jgi:hypothetical protein
MLVEYLMEAFISALLGAFVCHSKAYAFLVISTILGIITTITMKTGFYNPFFTTLEWGLGRLTAQEAGFFAVAQATGVLTAFLIYKNLHIFT